MSKAKKRISFQLRALAVWEALASAENPLTIQGIADRAGLKRSPYLKQIVDTLYAHGYISRQAVMSESGHGTVVYWVIKEPPKVDIGEWIVSQIQSA